MHVPPVSPLSSPAGACADAPGGRARPPLGASGGEWSPDMSAADWEAARAWDAARADAAARAALPSVEPCEPAPLPSFRRAARERAALLKRRAARWLASGAPLRWEADRLSAAAGEARGLARWARKRGEPSDHLYARALWLGARADALHRRAQAAARAAGVSPRAQAARARAWAAARVESSLHEAHAERVRRWNRRAGTAAPPAATVARDPLWVRTADNRRRNPEQAPPARPLSVEERASYEARRAARSARDRGEPVAHVVAWAGV